MNLTPAEIRAEREYRIQERLGILCEDRAPTAAQLEIATREADEWVESVKPKREQSELMAWAQRNK
jgi:hypothetical protein